MKTCLSKPKLPASLTFCNASLRDGTAPPGLYTNPQGDVVLVPTTVGRRRSGNAEPSSPVLIHWSLNGEPMPPECYISLNGPWTPVPEGTSVTITA